jgi:Arc/MetJ-type ribon-helix-helix transcriptional regulator
MQDQLISARIPSELKEKIAQLVLKGAFINESDLLRTALRELVRKHEVTAAA